MNKKPYVIPQILVEEWKVYKETNTNRWGHRVYEVSNFGRVKINGIITKPHITGPGYKRIGRFSVHRAVAELFIPNPENKPCVDHIDTNIHNNKADNLRWCTQKENCNNPLTRQHWYEAHKETLNKPEVKQNLSESSKKRWSNPEYRKNVTEKNKGLIWINKNNQGKKINPCQLNIFLNDGWLIGMPIKKNN